MASTILGIVLLVILIPAIRKAAGQDDRKYEQSIPDLHWVKFGGVLGTFIGTGTTIYLWSVWITVFRQDQIPLEAWQLVTGMCVSIGWILATGCMGAVAVVTGFISCRQGKAVHQAEEWGGKERGTSLRG